MAHARWFRVDPLLERLDAFDAAVTRIGFVGKPRRDANPRRRGELFPIEADAAVQHEEPFRSRMAVRGEVCVRPSGPRMRLETEAAQRTLGVGRRLDALDHPRSASIFAATMKSFRVSPDTACVISSTSRWPHPTVISG